MLTLTRHGEALNFDETGFVETPYVYQPIVKMGKLYEEAFLGYVRSLNLVGHYVDVGAHLGTHTVWFAKMCPATHVHAFEPVRRYSEVVCRNVIANGLDAKVTIYRKGLGTETGRVVNCLSLEHQVGFADGVTTGVTEEFEVEPLDDILTGDVALIKLDVEGMELAVLRGAVRILSQHRPVIFAEAHTPVAAREIEEFLAPFGYHLTGRVFNWSPTYEFVARPLKPVEWFWSAYRRARSGLWAQRQMLRRGP